MALRTTPPGLSVIVPMFQAAATVEATVRSALRAAERDGGVPVGTEVIVCDDGSRDAGPAIVQRLASEDQRVRLVARTMPGAAGGPGAARNRGLDAAKGRYVRFLDADDLAMPGSHASLIDWAEHTQPPAAAGSHEIVDEAGEPLGRVAPALAGPRGDIGPDELAMSNRFGTGAMVIRRDAIGTARFDESMRHCEDWEFWSRLARSGVRWAVLPPGAAPVKRYRVRPGGLSRRFGAMLLGAAEVLRRGGAAEGSPALRGQALAYATMQALAAAPDDGSNDAPTDAAIALLDRAASSTIDGRALAEATLWGIILGRGERPESVAGLAAVDAWWARLLIEKRLSEDARRAAAAELAMLLVPAEQVAAALAAAAARIGATRVVIMGYGSNGRPVAGAARSAGLPVEVRDDRLCSDSAAARACGLQPGSIRPLGDPAPMADGAVIIVSPLQDEAVYERTAALHGHRRILRWSATAAALAERYRPRLGGLGGGGDSPVSLAGAFGR